MAAGETASAVRSLRCEHRQQIEHLVVRRRRLALLALLRKVALDAAPEAHGAPNGTHGYQVVGIAT